MVSRRTTVKNPSGLHARPASVFVLKAKSFLSDITLAKANSQISTPVNAKSIMMILALGVSKGTPVVISCSGPDERVALDALVGLVESGCGE
jgi:phosphocarrier protein